MVDGTAVKATLTAVLTRADLKKTVVIEHNTLTANDFGELVPTFSSQDTEEGIPLDYKKFNKKYDVGGQYANSSLILLLPAGTTVSEQDTVVVFNEDYDIAGISKWSIGEDSSNNAIHVAIKVFLIEK